MTRAPRLAFVVPGGFDRPTGGNNYDARLAEALADAGARLTMVKLAARYPDPEAVAERGDQARLAALGRHDWVIGDGLVFGARPAWAAELARRYAFAALVHHPLALETGLDAATAARFRQQETATLSRAQRVIATSADTAARLRRDFAVPARRLAVIEPGTDPAPLSPARPDAQGNRLLAIGALTPRKGHDVLLDALAGLIDRSWHLDLAGPDDADPRWTAQLRHRAEQAGIAQRISWHGRVDDDIRADLYDRATLFVMPSRYEGFGMAAREALAHGLPSLVSAAGGLIHAVPAGAGWHVPPGDVSGWHRALARILDAPHTHADLRARARAARAGLPDWRDAAEALLAELSPVSGDACPGARP